MLEYRHENINATFIALTPTHKKGHSIKPERNTSHALKRKKGSECLTIKNHDERRKKGGKASQKQKEKTLPSVLDLPFLRPIILYLLSHPRISLHPTLAVSRLFRCQPPTLLLCTKPSNPSQRYKTHTTIMFQRGPTTKNTSEGGGVY